MSENTVYIGRKPVLVYVTAIMSHFGRNPKPEKVVVKARGRSISTAVDVVEVTRNRYLSDLEPEVSIGTEQMEAEEGGTRNVSTIEITLRRSPQK